MAISEGLGTCDILCSPEVNGKGKSDIVISGDGGVSLSPSVCGGGT